MTETIILDVTKTLPLIQYDCGRLVGISVRLSAEGRTKKWSQ